MSEMLNIEVAYATPEKQQIVKHQVAEGTSVFEGAQSSSIAKIFPEIDFDKADMGIFGKAVRQPKKEFLKEGDRIEIYRPLLIDPKQARLNRAAK